MKTILFWLPRALAFVFAFFLMMFSFDVLEMPAPFWKKVGGFMIHTIPTFLIIFFVLISWKKSLWGSSLFSLLFVIATLYFKTYMKASSFTIISLPLLIIALLYTLEFLYKKRK